MKPGEEKRFRDGAREVIQTLQELEARCAYLGLYATMRAVHDAISRIGWEVAARVTEDPKERARLFAKVTEGAE